MNQENNCESWLNRWFLLLLSIGIVVNATGLFITILDSDGTLYASIAKTIAQTNDFVNLKVGGKDWLDKPHFPFWMAAISYKIFGINTIAYKIPAFLFWLMGCFYTFLFASKLYGKNIAQFSVLFYVSATHLFISNNDVRAEPYLTGLIIGAIYHFYIVSISRNGWIKHLLIASFFTGCAMMTKGPFVLIPIGCGFVLEWIVKKDWKQFYSIKWIAAIVLVLLFTLPELYCLYQQFDIHPEKIVFEKTRVSGIKFFFWDSQFGRFFNNGPIKGEGDPFFYLHTMIWAFLPWGLLFYFAILWKTIQISKRSLAEEFICYGGGVGMFLVFSLSKFQLPHYLNILFPFFCIVTAQYLVNESREIYKTIIRYIQYVLIVASLIVFVALLFFYRPENQWIAIALLAITTSSCLVFFNKEVYWGAFGKSIIAVMGVFLFLNTCIYPSLMTYQSGSEAAKYVNEKYPNTKEVAMFNENSYSYIFYTHAPVFYGDMNELKKEVEKHSIVVYTNKQGLDSLQNHGFQTDIPKVFPFYHTSELTGEFIYYKTRSQTLVNHYVTNVWLKKTSR